MEIEKFEQAKKIKENLERLERQKYKLESSLKSCMLGVTISFTHSGAFNRKDEVSLYNKEAIREMINTEIKRVSEEIELVREEFKSI